MSAETTVQPADVTVTTRGDVPDSMAEYAAGKVREVYRYTGEPVRVARVVLTQYADPARDRSAVAEAALVYDATSVRAQAAASEIDAAIDLAAGRLRAAVVRHQDRVRTRHRWLAQQESRRGAQEWRHGDLPAPRLPHYRRPVEQRDIVRRKTFHPDPMSIDEAAFDLEQMDYDFYLFTHVASGQVALVRRRDAGGYAVQGEVDRAEATAGFVVLEGPAPVMDEAEARAHLDLAAEPYAFFLDRDTGQGRVLYTRYDGHYGLIAAD